MKLTKLKEGITLSENKPRFQKRIQLGGDPLDKNMEKLAYSIVHQLRDPEHGIHAMAGASSDGWFVTVAVNQAFESPPLNRNK